MSFNTLFWIYTGIVLILVFSGAWFLCFRLRPWRTRGSRGSWLSPFLIIAALVIGYQMYTYISGMHLDEDDARWIAEANDALVKNRMMLYNPATGEYLGRFVGEMIKDVFSPWSMYLAVLSRWTGIKAVVIAHTVYPPVLLGLSYFAYYEIGAQLFADVDTEGQSRNRVSERGIFLLMVSVINLFLAGNVYTQPVFALTRIWQGKAVVASVGIPAILAISLRLQKSRYDIENTNKNEAFGSISDWLLLIAVGVGSCLFSGMGIAIGLLMISVYGFYVVVRMLIIAIREKSWGGFLIRTGLWLLSLAPGIVYGLSYFNLKG